MAEIQSVAFSAQNERQKFIARTYGWMAAALVISALAAFATAASPALLGLLFGHHCAGFFILAIGELALVWWLSASIAKITTTAATVAFVAYSIINGMTLSSVLVAYTGAAVSRAFIIAALMFGGMSLYGAVTKQNLATAGRYLLMAVWGVVIASLINFLLRSSFVDWLVSIVTVVLFTGLTAYDSQKILAAARCADGSDTFKKAAIVGALELYLDFINIFLSLIRLFGRRGD